VNENRHCIYISHTGKTLKQVQGDVISLKKTVEDCFASLAMTGRGSLLTTMMICYYFLALR